MNKKIIIIIIIIIGLIGVFLLFSNNKKSKIVNLQDTIIKLKNMEESLNEQITACKLSTNEVNKIKDDITLDKDTKIKNVSEVTQALENKVSDIIQKISEFYKTAFKNNNNKYIMQILQKTPECVLDTNNCSVNKILDNGIIFIKDTQDKLEQIIKEIQATIQKLEMELSNCESNINGIKIENDKMQKEIDVLQNTIDERITEFNSIDKKFTEFKTLSKGIINKYQTLQKYIPELQIPVEL